MPSLSTWKNAKQSKTKQVKKGPNKNVSPKIKLNFMNIPKCAKL